MDGVEISVHIFVDQDSKITNVYKSNDKSMLLKFYFWQPVYYLLDPEDLSFGVKLKKRAR